MSIKYIFLVLIVAFASCDLSLLGTNRSRQYSIVSPEDEISQIPHEDFFFVNIKSAYYTGEGFDPLDFLLYAREEGPGTDCKISFTEDNASTEDLFCMFEVAEGDLYLHEINFEYNVPPGMCNYLSFMTHWHYNYKSGYGPPRVDKYDTGRIVDNNPVFKYRGCLAGSTPEYSCTTDTETDTEKCTTKNDCETASHTCNNNTGTAGKWTPTSQEGVCTGSPRCTNETECENPDAPCHAGLWETAYCYPSARCTTQAQCTNDYEWTEGSCSVDTHTTEQACTDASATWTAGECSLDDIVVPGVTEQEDCEDREHACHSGGRHESEWRDDYCYGAPQCTTRNSCEDITHGCHQGLWDNRSQTCSVAKCHDDDIGNAAAKRAACVSSRHHPYSGSQDRHPCHAGTWNPNVTEFCTHPNCTTRNDCETASHTCNNRAGFWVITYPGCQVDEDANKTCKYITTKGDQEINCCIGDYRVFDENGDIESENEWGGDIQQCIGGLGRMKWDSFDDDGFPIPLVTPTGAKGIVKEYQLKPLLDTIKGARVSFPVANFYEGIEEEDEEVSLPDFRSISSFTAETPNNKSYPYLTWSCLDQNYDVRHQINLIIREWNTNEEFLSFKESEGGRGDPDAGGVEGSECEYYEKSALPRFGDCNDLIDLDDWGSNYPKLTYQ